MKLTFLGATHEVTGSCYYLEACGKKILIDCGMEQGPDLYENEPLPVAAGEIDMVLLTHAHMDHSGNIPLLYKQGFRGQVFSTVGTAALCRIMLMDAAHIQEFEAEWKNRKNQRAGKELVEPLYTQEDAEGAISCFVGVEYETERYIAEGICLKFIDAGHLLGSSSIELTISEAASAAFRDASGMKKEPWAGETADPGSGALQGLSLDPETAAALSTEIISRKIVFSGDIGNTDQPLISNPVCLTEADYVVMESTYGDRLHERPERLDYALALAGVIQRTFDRGGNVVIPSFAVGRTQEILYFIREIKQRDLVQGHDGFKVWVDSPLANEATNIFLQRMYSDFDKEAKALLEEGINPIGFEGLKTSVTAEDSKAINDMPDPKVIISASGMCDAGRIKHHLKHNLWRPESTVLFVGYQAVGTPGRAILEGAGDIKLFGEEIEIRAEICSLPGVSGHADRDGLLQWIGALRTKPKMVFVTHGEDEVTEIFRDRLINDLQLNAYAPFSGTRFDLASGRFEKETGPVPIQKEERVVLQIEKLDGGSYVQAKGSERRALKKISSKNKKAAAIFARLVDAGNRLMNVIRKNQGGANKDLGRFTEEINRLCEKWDR